VKILKPHFSFVETEHAVYPGTNVSVGPRHCVIMVVLDIYAEAIYTTYPKIMLIEKAV
jgi:hypothetical protein